VGDVYQPAALVDDGLLTPEVGPWTLQKHALIKLYAEIFSTSMKDKWSSRVFLDLFAGAGRGLIEGTKRIIPGSPMIAMAVPNPFTHYVFCEANHACADALRKRLPTLTPAGSSATVVEADVNAHVDRATAALPMHGSGQTVLTLCLVDPFKIKDLDFGIIRRLAQRKVDFLCLLPTFMDANRNEKVYLAPGNKNLDRFLGQAAWRTRWANRTNPNLQFGDFVRQEFEDGMKAMEYLVSPGASRIVQHDEGAKLYHLELFSRHPLAEKFWKDSLKYTTPQSTFFDAWDRLS